MQPSQTFGNFLQHDQNVAFLFMSHVSGVCKRMHISPEFQQVYVMRENIFKVIQHIKQNDIKFGTCMGKGFFHNDNLPTYA